MNIKKLFSMFIIVFLFCILSISIISATNVNSFTELNDTISAGENVNLTGNIIANSDEALKFHNGIEIKESITINGNGYSIDANKSMRIFNVVGEDITLTLINVTLKNGQTYKSNNLGADSDNAGAIYTIYNLYLNTVGNVNFINNSAIYNGGAISSKNVIINSEGNLNFINNSAINAGAIYALTGNVIINSKGNVVFNKNIAKTGIGGAIYSKIANFNITGDLNFYNNLANGSYKNGGAISTTGNIIINVTGNVNFNNNSAKYDGGAIITNKIIFNITGDLNFINNEASQDGGVIFSTYDVIMDVKGNMNFTKNKANNGGAVYISNNNLFIYSVVNGFFNDNVAVDGSGGVFYVKNVYINNVSNIFFINNSAKKNGGVIRIGSGNININVTKNVIFTNNVANQSGGALYSFGVINITNAIFYGNNASNGKAIYLNNVKNNNINFNFWGTNYNDPFSFINDKLIFDESINNYTVPDNWILLNMVVPDKIIINKNSTFQLRFNILTNGTHNRTYFSFNSSMIVKLNSVYGDFPEYVYVGQLFNYTTSKSGKNSIIVINHNIDKIIMEYSFMVNKNNPNINITDVKLINSTDGVIKLDLPNDINGSLVIIVNNRKNSFNLTGEKIFNINGLIGGENNITIFYEGNDKYDSFNKSSLINVSKLKSNLTLIVKDVIYGENVNVLINLNGENDEKISGNVTLFINYKKYVVEVRSGSAILYLENYSAGDYIGISEWNGNDYYYNTSFIVNWTINKANATFIINTKDIGYGEIENITIQASNNLNGIALISHLFDYDVSVFIKNGIGSINIPDLKPGKYDIIGTFLIDNPNYNTVYNTSSFIVNKNNPNINITDVKLINSTDGVIKLDLPNDINGSIVIIVNNRKNSFNLTGEKIFNINGLIGGENNITIFYEGNDKYDSFNKSSLINVSKLKSNLTLIVKDVIYGENVNVLINLNGENDEKISGNVTFIVNYKKYVVEVRSGSAILYLENYSAGDYIGISEWNGNDYYYNTSFIVNWTINKANATFIINTKDIKYGEIENITIQAGNNLNGIALISHLFDYDINVFIKNGIGSINIPDLKPGKYDIIGTFLIDNPNYNTAYNTSSFSVIDKEKSSIIVNIRNVYYIGDVISEVVSVIPNNATGVVNVYSNGYLIASGDLVNGSAFFTYTVPDMPGQWKLEVVYSGDDKYYGSSVSKDIEVKYKDNILFVEDLEKYYGQDSPLIAVLLDFIGEPLSGEIVTFNINGKTYTRTTNDYGVVAMNINLNPGDYTVEVASGNLTETVTVTVLNTISGEDVVKMYKNGTQYYASFLDSEGNALANTNVTFNINGVFYTRTTDAKGVAKLNINLLPGNYILTTYNPATGEAFSNNIVVLPILVGEDLTKVYGKVAAYEVIAYDNIGNPLSGVIITININGVFYNKITDSNGRAFLNINLAPGEYVSTAYFNGFATSNKITVLEA